MDLRSVLSYLGRVLEFFGVLLIIPVLVCLIYGEDLYASFIWPAIFSLIIGFALDKRFEKSDLNLGSAMMLSALTLVAISLIGSIPYLGYLKPLDSVFESVSGFTTTGLSVTNPEGMPYSLLFWRSFSQWIGGLGILVLFLLMVSSPGISSYYIYEAEGKTQRIRASTHSTIKRIFFIYGLYTAIGIVLLLLVGMPFFDSVAHTFSAISTGGFSTKSSSIAFYDSIWVELAIIFLMTLGATSFFIHDRLLKGDIKGYLKSKETQMFWIIIVLFSLAFSVFFVSQDPFRSGIFHAFSALTTTGFSTVSSFSEISKFLIIILMVIGGYAGSTAGGLKLIRIGILSNIFSWLNRKITSPLSAVIPFKFDKKMIGESEVTILSLYTLIYILILVVSALVIGLYGYSLSDSIFISASAQGTTGLSTIDVYPMTFVCKFVLMIDMLFGRLEILPFMVLFYHIFSGFRRKS